MLGRLGTLFEERIEPDLAEHTAMARLEMDREFKIEEAGQAIELGLRGRGGDLATGAQVRIGSQIIAGHGHEEVALTGGVD